MSTEDEEYKGHKIRVEGEGKEATVHIDDEKYDVGVTTDGEYFLDVYAYDRSDDLMEVVKQYIDFVEETETTDEEDEQ